ncbi:MFS transporter [Lactococcus kimchii]|uniref:MFS transporter n=1 Tax=Lactococcus sp. S-13 TaxID=2507158 RepID=UPI0010236F45|nr:MFS transporter [Lactococcus sp. S-13]RZI49182.1 MFS transporter [Lactococcus sp. S-13]
MTTKKLSPFLIFIVFIIFISLGLPDSVMGSAWPAIRQTYGFSIDMIGIFGAIQLGFSFCSTLVYPFLAKRWTIDRFILFSTLLTIFGLFALGFGQTTPYMLISCLFLGFGQGSIDITVNDFSAKHFSNSLINFLHGFYGIGVSLSSFIMTFAVQPGRSWQLGVWIITIVQILILLLAYFTRDKFREKAEVQQEEKSNEKLKFHHFLLPLFYFFYALELLVGRFYSSFAVEHLHLSLAVGAAITSFYWTGLTIGRFLTGFTAQFWTGRTIVLVHTSFLFLGALLGFFPYVSLQYCSGILLGLGLAPLYPLGMKQVYNRYSGGVAQKVISFNMAFANFGMFFLPIPVGWLFEQLGFGLYPLVMFLFAIALILLCLKIYQKTEKSV